MRERSEELWLHLWKVSLRSHPLGIREKAPSSSVVIELMLKNPWPWMEVMPGVCKNFKKNCQKPFRPATLVVRCWPQFSLRYDRKDKKL